MKHIIEDLTNQIENVWYNAICEILDNVKFQNKKERRKSLMKKNYDEIILEIFIITEDAVRCSKSGDDDAEDIFG